MYDTLRPELITATPDERRAMEMDPTAVVEKGMFMQNPFPYLEVRRPFILGTQSHKWKATISHRFADLLHTKLQNKLARVFTQNIDGLDFQCEALHLDHKIVPVHGTIGKVACEFCGIEANYEQFCHDVRANIKDIYGVDEDAPKESSSILCKNCKRPAVKPTTVLFGSSLPDDFFEKAHMDVPQADLLIVAGTSLVVSPANSLVNLVPTSCLRVIVNKEPVGEFLGIDYDTSSLNKRDFFACGNCDEVFLDLICQLGWLDDIEKYLDDLPPSSAEMVRNRKREQG